MSALDDLKTRLADAEPAFAVKGSDGRRQLMNYSAPQQRVDNCKGCSFVGHTLLNTGSLFEREDLHCQVGGFKVAGSGVCEHYARAK